MWSLVLAVLDPDGFIGGHVPRSHHLLQVSDQHIPSIYTSKEVYFKGLIFLKLCIEYLYLHFPTRH